MTLPSDRSRYLDFAPERACPLCGSDDALILSRRMQFGLDGVTRLCRACAFAYVSPVPKDAALRRYYAEAYAHDYRHLHPEIAAKDCRATPREERRFADIERFHALAGARLLEIGPGNGRFLYLARRRGALCSVVEPAGPFAERLAAQGIAVAGDYLEDLAGTTTYDVIALFQVLEHLVDPCAGLERLRACLAPGGIVVLDVPNLRKPYGHLDRSFYRYVHLSYFSPSSLYRLCTRAGFTVLHLDDGGDNGLEARPLLVILAADARTGLAAPAAETWQEVADSLATYRRRYPFCIAPRLWLDRRRRALRRRLAAGVAGRLWRRLKRGRR